MTARRTPSGKGKSSRIQVLEKTKSPLAEAAGAVGIPTNFGFRSTQCTRLTEDNAAMISTQVPRYRCQNPNCRAEIGMTDASAEATTMPKCSCGALRKKVYAKPVFKELNGHPVFTWVRKT